MEWEKLDFDGVLVDMDGNDVSNVKIAHNNGTNDMIISKYKMTHK